MLKKAATPFLKMATDEPEGPVTWAVIEIEMKFQIFL
jgi:hypothetical protein